MNKIKLDSLSDHLLVFDSYDCNDPDWETVIKCLEEHLPNFNVFYGDGDMLNFRWDDKKGEELEAKNFNYYPGGNNQAARRS